MMTEQHGMGIQQHQEHIPGREERLEDTQVWGNLEQQETQALEQQEVMQGEQDQAGGTEHPNEEAPEQNAEQALEQEVRW